jgi:hypothetical protein
VKDKRTQIAVLTNAIDTLLVIEAVSAGLENY